MTVTFFLRHGPTIENREERIQGQQPGTLLVGETERYLTAVVPLLREQKLDLLLSSDLERAIQTRDILKRFLLQENTKGGVSALLREKAMGLYEGMLWSEVPAEFREQRSKEKYDFRTFGGENDKDVLRRVQQMLREIALRYGGKRLCCVTHAGWLEQLVHLAGGVGILPDQWSDRSAIYEVGIGPVGELLYFHPIEINADIELDDE